jgi:dUTP pyrophosphatase
MTGENEERKIKRLRGFEKVSSQTNNDKIILPKRKTKNSVAYDIYSPIRTIIKPKNSIRLNTGIKAYFQDDEALFIIPRSSVGIKHGIRLKNTVGLIDSDYYNNEDNDGEIILSLENNSDKDFVIEQGDRICQAYFQKILFTDNDEFETSLRVGGLGSTGK